ncbi:hypothetical protein KIN20_024578 [Parelaphostrongylus tenuis]|uniref:Uncharacterized protein n=1 Tax=Parelaphostrongylus tenuis TaxID=148309 RepID=A0AAD5N7R2_PARTN|nr:hypothetical protein KIN20_024578 [Parelaphostrongylus tenuis]
MPTKNSNQRFKAICDKGSAHHLLGSDRDDSLGLSASRTDDQRQHYCRHLNRCSRVLSRRRRRNLTLLQENVRLHVAELTKSKLIELG